MKSKILVVLLALTLGMIPALLAVENVNNKFCPISGEGVAEHGKPYEHEYKGKVYNLCCKMCLKDFEKDPEGYIKKMEEKEKAGTGHSEHGK